LRRIARAYPGALSKNGDRPGACSGAATLEEAATELAAIPDTPDLKAADEAIVRSDHGNVPRIGPTPSSSLAATVLLGRPCNI